MVMPAQEQVDLQVVRFEALKNGAPSGLTAVLNTIEGMIQLVVAKGGPEQAHTRYTTGPLGEWVIARFATNDGIVWIAIIWPKVANGSSFATWLKERASQLHMTLPYSYIPSDQLWLYFGSRM